MIVYFFLLLNTIRQLHPYEYLYFNALVGGLKGAAGRYETDYWGKTNREAILWLRDHELAGKSGTYRIETCGSPRSSTYYFNQKMIWVPLLSDADYFVCFTRNADYNQMDDKDTIHAVTRLGVPLNYVRKIP